MNNYEKIKYTYKHRKIVMYLANKYIKNNKNEILDKIKLHDMDKMFLLIFYDKEISSKIHRENTLHHSNELQKNKNDYIEMVLDWESARYTKPDKPLNAYETLYKYYPELEKEILPILKEFSIDKPNLPMKKDVIEYTKSLENIDENQIKNELIEFIKLS